MNLPELSIRRHVFAFMLNAVLILFGVIAYDRIGVDKLPYIEFPVISVSTTQRGANPEVIENPNLIYPGEVFAFPDVGTPPVESAPPAPPLHEGPPTHNDFPSEPEPVEPALPPTACSSSSGGTGNAR